MTTSEPLRILVTGASGFVGGWLLERLTTARFDEADILALGRAAGSGPVSYTELDITRAADVDVMVKSFRPTTVVHLAGVSSLVEARAETRRTWEVNLFGTLNLAEAVLRHAPDARFIQAGSAEVYGGTFVAAGGTVDETALLDPRNPYATTKAAADLMLGQMSEAGLRAVRFRPFNHTGPGQSIRFAVPSFAAQIAAIERGEAPPVIKVGNLDAQRDFLDVRDVVEAYLLAVEAPALPWGVVMNVASGEPRRIGDVLDAMLSLSRAPIRVEPDPALMRPSDVPVTAGDSSRLRALLGWQPAIAWTTTLRDILDSHRKPT